jgi:hypothetical protein
VLHEAKTEHLNQTLVRERVMAPRTSPRASRHDRPAAPGSIGAEIVLTVEASGAARAWSRHIRAELVGAIADTRATFEAKGWASGGRARGH